MKHRLLGKQRKNLFPVDFEDECYLQKAEMSSNFVGEKIYFQKWKKTVKKINKLNCIYKLHSEKNHPTE